MGRCKFKPVQPVLKVPGFSSSIFNKAIAFILCFQFQLAPPRYNVANVIYQALGRGVTRSKRRGMQWCRKAAENGHTYSCQRLASAVYGDLPYAREVGLVAEAAGVTSAGFLEGHDVPPEVLTSVLHWFREARQGGHCEQALV